MSPLTLALSLEERGDKKCAAGTNRQTKAIRDQQFCMQLARVIGRATSTVKHPALNGWRMLLVQPLDIEYKADGEPLLAIDNLGAGRGDIVMMTSDGAAVREMMGADNTPVRWAILGLADEMD